MGQVYQATDTKLHRDVALKVLPQAFTDDPDRLARFEREATVLASLNHPNIGHIYGLEEAEGQKALVLELVEGPTLEDRIRQGPIPIDEALPIAKQIAEALEAAHEVGVIHRDLKPANIKVKDDGTVKVLDFGLAKALDTTPKGDPSLSPTLTAAATQMGVIMGTAAYMSPEQARGRPVDKRADIWSFGVVLYEMLTGQRAFQGEDVSLTLASVMKSDVDVQVLPIDLPSSVLTAIRQCLQKNPGRRVRDIGDVQLTLEGAFESAIPTTEASPGPAPHRRLVTVGLMALAVVSVASFYVGSTLQPPPVDADVMQFVIPTRNPVALSVTSPFSDLTLLRDGSQLIYRDNFVGGEGRLNVRPINGLATRRLEGVSGVINPFVSPDGASVGCSGLTGVRW